MRTKIDQIENNLKQYNAKAIDTKEWEKKYVSEMQFWTPETHTRTQTNPCDLSAAPKTEQLHGQKTHTL